MIHKSTVYIRDLSDKKDNLLLCKEDLDTLDFIPWTGFASEVSREESEIPIDSVIRTLKEKLNVMPIDRRLVYKIGDIKYYNELGVPFLNLHAYMIYPRNLEGMIEPSGCDIRWFNLLENELRIDHIPYRDRFWFFEALAFKSILAEIQLCKLEEGSFFPECIKSFNVIKLGSNRLNIICKPYKGEGWK